MTATTFSDVKDTLNMVQKYWAPVLGKQLRESTLWMNFTKNHYEYAPNLQGEMVPVKGGDTIYISTLVAPTSTVRTWGTDADSFDSNRLQNVQTTLTVNKRAVSSYEFESIGVLASQLNDPAGQSSIRDALLFDIRKQVNDYIKSLINPSASAPDHVLNSVTDYTFTQHNAVRTLASDAKWFDSGEQVITALSPSYMSDLIDETVTSNSEYNGGDTPVVSGAFRKTLLGMNIYEDNSLSTDYGYSLIPSWAVGAYGTVQFELEKLISNKRFGYILVGYMDFGCVQHDNKRIIKVYNS